MFRRYAFGSIPLNVWARSAYAADVTAGFHAACMRFKPVRG